MENNQKVRTRFAPSPTGFIHVGNLRTVLFGYLIAKKYGGDWLLRIEDTDQKRKVEGAVEKLLETLDWVGLTPDEGLFLNQNGEVEKRGDFGSYVQSERLEIYQKYVNQLVEQGSAYYCFCTPERLAEVREKQQQNKEAPRYDGHCRNLSKEEVEKRIAAGEKFVVRMKVPEGETVEFDDLVYGKIRVESKEIDDQVILKSDGYPTYHLAVVIDDHLMQISHVVRAEEWLPSAPKHVLLYQFFGWELPNFVHVPNVVNENRKKLSKRQGDVSVEDFKNKGYLPEALINFLALLGWNPGKGETQEIFSLEELIERFDENNIHRAGAVFDYKKLDWINAHYIKQKSDEELLKLCLPYFEKYFEGKESLKDADKNKELLLKIVSIEKQRIKILSEVVENVDFYFQDPEVDLELIRWKDMGNEDLKEILLVLKNGLEKIDFSNAEKIKEELMKIAGDDRGKFLHPLRTLLSGQKNSPAPWEIAWIIGKEKTVVRIDKVLKKL